MIRDNIGALLFLAGLALVALLLIIPSSFTGGPSKPFEFYLAEAKSSLSKARDATKCSWCKRRVDEIIGAVETLERIGYKASEVAEEYLNSPLSRMADIAREFEEPVVEVEEVD